ncbi:PaREP1 family protein [Sulfolobus islandicus Y.N.15.51]|uniref:PaREP1 family protein n=1 Tax=Saccharolobus islandicus (strain Y.N.15.51 / Yellowstone \|nr:PaREP1 family protein [Sulfolobus islandicus]ACP49023.1 PaREP1 family protein [Sulfolobus islandicus Y.N.15.51]
MEGLIKKAEEYDIDINDLIIDAISRKDPKGAINLRIELAKKYIAEAEDYLKKGDAVQASEKAYKTAEEIVKALAEKFNIPEYQQASKEGRWYTYWLASAVNRLTKDLGWVLNGWNSAYILHVWTESFLTLIEIFLYLFIINQFCGETTET